MKLKWPALFALCLVPLGTVASDPGMGTVLISVDAIQLNNRGNPTAYGQVLLEFWVKNLDTGKRFAQPPSSDRYPSMLRLPAGTYCLYSVRLFFNEELQYCKGPFFAVQAGRVSNVGRWRFGISHDAGTFKLLHAFEDQDAVAEQAVEHYEALGDGTGTSP